MPTLEEVRMETRALLRETEEQIAQVRQQRTILMCLSRDLLKLHARLKQHGIGSEKFPHLLAARGLLPNPLSRLPTKRQADHGQRIEAKLMQAPDYTLSLFWFFLNLHLLYHLVNSHTFSDQFPISCVFPCSPL